MLKNMTLIKRVALLNSFSLLSIIIIVVLSLYSLSEMNDNFNKVIEKDATKALLSKDIKVNLLEMHRAEKNLILSLTQKEMRGYNDNFLQAQKEIEKNIVDLRILIDTQNLSKLEAIKTLYDRYSAVYDTIYNLTEQNLIQKATVLSATKSKNYIYKARDLISEIVNYNDKVMHQGKILSDIRYDDAFSQLFIIFSIIFIFLVYFSFRTYIYFNAKLDAVYNKIDIIKTGRFEDTPEETESTDELGMIVNALNPTIKLLREIGVESKNQNWIKEGVNTLNKQLTTETDVVEVSKKSIDFLCGYLNAGVGSLYIFDKETETLNQYANYGYVQKEKLAKKFALGEGTVGQVACQNKPIQLRDVKQKQAFKGTGTHNNSSLNTYTFSLIHQNELFGVIELGSSEIFDLNAAEFLSLANDIITTALYFSQQSQKVKILQQETQTKNTVIEKANMQMQDKQQKLEEANAQMEEQQQQLEEANAQMEEQQQQLEEANAQMEEQQQQLEEKNINLEKSQVDLYKKAKDLELSGQYKSEFLANMSHELRTPLNSIILLSDMLQDDIFGHLDDEEIKKVSIIHSSGNELLRLINDVLDLSKIEAGKMDIIADSFESSTFNEEVETQFEHQAEEKNLEFTTSDSYKGIIYSDRDRLAQIVRNLISNALKFTKQGTISLDIQSVKNNSIKISVSDTGIGISDDKLRSIFEAFQQADGSTSRIYGGTGLGLSISKELVHMLGGEISVKSSINEGSTFSLIIPNMDKDTNQDKDNLKQIGNLKKVELKESNNFNIKNIDDRELVTAVDKVFLIIEDDKKFAGILREKINKSNEYALIAFNGEDGLQLAKEYDVKGVLLDLGLPDMNGIDVLKEFKMNPSLRKIPVYVISGEEKAKQTLEHGAIGYHMKPVARDDISHAIEKINSFNEKKVKDLLLVENDDAQREALLEFTQSGSVKSTGVSSKYEALRELDKGIYDGIIIDLGLSDGNGYEICEYIKENNIQIPIIIYTGKNLSAEEEQKLRQYTDTIVIKTVASQIRLLEEVDIFMHRVKVKNKDKIQNINDIDLSGTKILVADDDIRNIYVLSEALGSKGAKIITANNGKEAVDSLDAHSDIDVILMDIMMPVMDGYEATKIIKSNAKTKDIPIIAVTAKAMAEDRIKAIEAGCDDYISKPLKMDILLGIVKSWIS
jgi:signal transduction histidine kinase/DNA-binding response OmpR family regulator/CHASE3 domain sensor protein